MPVRVNNCEGKAYGFMVRRTEIINCAKDGNIFGARTMRSIQ